MSDETAPISSSPEPLPSQAAAPVVEAPRVIAVLGEIPFSGAAVIKALSEGGFHVRVLCPDQAAELAALAARSPSAPQSVTAVRGALDSEKAIVEAMSGAYAAVLLSPVTVDGRVYRRQSHLEDVRRVIEASEKSALRKLVYHSTLGAHPKALSRTMREALEAEKLIQSCRCEDYCVRTAPLMGRGDQFITDVMTHAKNGPPFTLMLGYGSTMMQPLHVSDMAACMNRILSDKPTEQSPGIYNLAGPDITTVLDLYDEALVKARRFKFKFHVPLFVLRMAASLRPKSAFEERVNLLYDAYCTEQNDTGKLVGEKYALKTTRQAEDEILVAG
jgi:uncharacterized protein YbjT (DUF2867 family)